MQIQISEKLQNQLFLLLFSLVYLLLIFCSYDVFNTKLPLEKQLEQQEGYLSKCWEFTRSGSRQTMHYLAIKLIGDPNIYSVDNLIYPFEPKKICKRLHDHRGYPIKIKYEKINYDRWNTKHLKGQMGFGEIWDLEQANVKMLKYREKFKIDQNNLKFTLIAFLFFDIVFLIPLISLSKDLKKY